VRRFPSSLDLFGEFVVSDNNIWLERNLVEGPTRDVKTLDFVLGSLGMGDWIDWFGCDGPVLCSDSKAQASGRFDPNQTQGNTDITNNRHVGK